MKKHLLLLIHIFVPALLFAQTNPSDSVRLKREKANQSFVGLYKENADLAYTSPLGEIGAPVKYVINGRLTTTYMLLIAGQNAHSRYFSEDIYNAGAEPKELMIIPNSVHVDLYDKMDVIPFDKMEDFFRVNLK